jgi:hypothetical protein
MTASWLIALLVTASPVPVPPKPAEAAAEFNRPPRDKRAKLLDILEIDLPAYLVPVWQEEGKRLVLLSEWGVADGKKSVTVAGIEIVKGLGCRGQFLGLTAKGTRWVEDVTKGSGLNAYHRLVTREFGDGTSRGGKSLDSVEFDRAADGNPVAVTPDGKTVFTIGTFFRKPATPGIREKVTYYFRALDGGSGEPQRTVATIDGDEEQYEASTFSPSRDRLYVSLRTQTGFAVRAFDTATGKLAWDRSFGGWPISQREYHSNRAQPGRGPRRSRTGRNASRSAP